MEWRLAAADLPAASALRLEIGRHLARRATPGTDLAAAQVAIAEVLTNALEHGGGDVRVELDWSSGSAILSVTDQGDGFDPTTLAALEPVDPVSRTGRGLLLATSLSRGVRQRRGPDGEHIVDLHLDVVACADTPTAELDRQRP